MATNQDLADALATLESEIEELEEVADALTSDDRDTDREETEKSVTPTGALNYLKGVAPEAYRGKKRAEEADRTPSYETLADAADRE